MQVPVLNLGKIIKPQRLVVATTIFVFRAIPEWVILDTSIRAALKQVVLKYFPYIQYLARF